MEMSNVCESADVIVVWHIKAYHCTVLCPAGALLPAAPLNLLPEMGYVFTRDIPDLF